MNCSLPIIRPLTLRLCALFWLCLATIATSVSAQNPPLTATQTNQLSTDRLLVILDISSNMQRRSENMQRIIGQIFSSGFGGQVRRGDTIGMWTFNDSLHTGEFPLQRWSPQAARQITSLAAQFAQNQRYSKLSTFPPVMAQLTNVIADSDRITVILLSDGSALPAGTPFDAEIAATFRLNADEQRRQAMPFVTVLRAVKGEFVGFKVSMPPWPIEYPAFPPEPTIAAPQPTNAPTAKTENPKPIAPVQTNGPTSESVETNHPTPIITNQPVVVETKLTPPETVTNPSPTVATSLPSPATNTTKAPPPSRTNPPTAIAPATPLPISKPERDSSTIPIIVGGIALVGLGILCLALLQRSRRPKRVSLITRSMNKDRK